MELLADYFNSISSEFVSLEIEDIPTTYDRPLYDITPQNVAEVLRKIKKPKSMVPGSSDSQRYT